MLTAEQFTTAIRLAAARGLLPTAMGSADLQGTLTASERRRVLALARVTQGSFLSEVKQGIAEMMADTLGRSQSQLIAHLKSVLQRLDYDPATGFPGDAALDVPPAEPGSLQDLSSWKRLSLIIDTERALANGLSEELNGNTEIARALFPAWRLVRIEDRDQPRGTVDEGSPGWERRWIDFGGPPLVEDGGKLHMIAGKDDPIWQALGDQSLYDAKGYNDLALGTSYPPFAIRSGYGRLAVSRAEVTRLGITLRGEPQPLAERAELPPVKTEAKSLDPQTRTALLARLQAIRELRAAA